MISDKNKIETFRDLLAWQKAHALVLEVYKVTKQFPSEEKFVLVPQIRRSASSVPTNIVEGYKKRGQKEFLRFLNMSDGSLEETKYHLILGHDLGYIKSTEYNRLIQMCNEVGRLLSGLQRSLAANHHE